MNPLLLLIPIGCIFLGIIIYFAWKMMTAPPLIDQKLKDDISKSFNDLGTLLTDFQKLPPEEQQKIRDQATQAIKTITPIATRTIETISPTANYILTGKKPEKDEPKKSDKKEPPDLWT